MKPLFTLILLATAASGVNAQRLPLSTGNIWTYRSVDGAETFTIRVGAPLWMQSGRIYHYLTGYTDQVLLTRIDEQGNLVALNEENNEEALVTGFGSTPDQWWPAPARTCLQEGQAQKDPTSHEGLGGRWPQTLEVVYRTFSCADAGVESEQFVENVGMVRRVVGTIAGPRVFDLVYARIGTMVIEPIDRGRFTVTVVERSGGLGWDVNLRLDLGLASLRLGFESAQDYEVVLNDRRRNVRWTWSEGQFFAQGGREKEFVNQWDTTVFVPRPEGLAGDLEGFTIDAWLTTAPGQPKYAASAPIPPSRLSSTADRNSHQ